MKQYMTIYNYLDDLVIHKKCIIHPETLTLYNLLLNSIKINKINLTYTLYSDRKY